MIQDKNINTYLMFPSIFYQNRDIPSTVSFNDIKDVDSQFFGRFGKSPLYKVSVILVSNSKKINSIVDSYKKYGVVNEILISSKNGCKRFETASKAKNCAVLIQDTDVVLPEQVIVDLANSLMGDPDKIHFYKHGNAGDDTKTMMTRRSWSKKYLRHIDEFGHLYNNACNDNTQFSNFISDTYDYSL
jgi:hypothetical protein